PYGHSIGHCQRCDTIIEPVVSQQWFVSMKPLAEPAMAAVKDGRIKIMPRRFTRVYLHWMENIRDWCISRQLWWGHRIPVWYCDDCSQVTVALEDPSQCEHCGSTSIQQDPDVLDTWFSSALWPHSTLGWPDDTEDLRYFYPTTVMETGYDILFFWVARMIMMGLYNMGQVPFRTVYLHGLLRDRDGRKMTKSLGNVVDPVQAATKYGTDALRYVLATGGAPGNDMRISDERLEGGRNFANKVWNAARFVITSLADETVEPPQPGQRDGMPLEDRWIMSRLHKLTGDVEKLLSAFQVGEAGRQVHDFFWGDFCDWYIEMAKVRLKADDPSPLPLLAHVLDMSLRLLHPFMPFLTEAIWQNLRPHLRLAEAEPLIVAPWPRANKRWHDNEAEAQAQAVMDVVRAIRNIRAEQGVEPARCVEVYLVADGMRRAAETSRLIIEALARVRPLHIVDGAGAAPREQVITAVLRDVQVVVPLAGLFDVEAERARLRREVDDAQAEVARLEAKLANEQFRTRAPAAVVGKEEEKMATARARLEGLQARLEELT
ncbi:MAG: class I tRNA ligase family protein, partial [Dehalococcoidia bacterium]|nr:class I tRNA ligase family protein [Dehalococcoidia bacterium]